MSNRSKKRSISEAFELYNEGGKNAKIQSELRIGEHVDVGYSLSNEPALADGDRGDEVFMLRCLSNPLKKVKVYLPKLKLPEFLPEKDEKAMVDLHQLLRGYGFEIMDRRTLAFFAIGKQHNVQAAAQCFQEFYKLVSTLQFRSPDLCRIKQLVADGVIEGFACQSDGNAGVMMRPGN